MFCILDLSVSVSPVRRLNMRSALIMPVLYMAHSNKGGGTGTSVEIPSHVDGSYSDNALISSLVKELPSRICRKCSVNNFECFPRRKAKLERKHIYPSISKIHNEYRRTLVLFDQRCSDRCFCISRGNVEIPGAKGVGQEVLC